MKHLFPIDFIWIKGITAYIFAAVLPNMFLDALKICTTLLISCICIYLSYYIFT